jgi:hypothetical protein
MVDKALVLENRRGVIERKRKVQRTGAQGSHKRFCDGSPSQGPVFHPGQQQRMKVAMQRFQTPQRQIQRPNFQSPRSYNKAPVLLANLSLALVFIL